MSKYALGLVLFSFFATSFVYAAHNNRVEVTAEDRKVLQAYGARVHKEYLDYKRNLYQQYPTETYTGHTVIILPGDDGSVSFQGYVLKKNL